MIMDPSQSMARGFTFALYHCRDTIFLPINSMNEKITDSHSTSTKTSSEVVAAAAKLDAVTKIGLGTIKRAPGGRRDLKFLPITGGIKAVVRGAGAVQDIYIYTKHAKEVQEEISRVFRK
ncbi:MAG: hypothetical protein JWO73_825 [Candidatus Taylorbacteria bacterium]|nr:hypothetical protein [Candidatus Taylorbacteria bacterium]